MAFALPNRCRFNIGTAGTGTITVGTAIAGFQTPATAGVAVGSTVGYGIEDGTAWEVGIGTYQAGGLLTRDVVEASSSGGTKLSLSGAATGFLTTTGGLLAPLWDSRGRNKVINPTFRNQQRGTGSWTTNAVFMADRWFLQLATDTVSASISALTDAQRTAIGDEEAASGLVISVTGNAAAGAYSGMAQRIEDARRLAGRNVTVSFFAVAPTSFKLGVSLDQNWGSGGSPSATVAGTGTQVTLGTSFARYSVPLALASAAGKTFGTNNDSYTQLNLWTSSGATNSARAGAIGVQTGAPIIWGVQLEIGGVATPLEKPEPALDLEACERFYQPGQVWMAASAGAAGNVGYMMALRTTMRGVPTIAFSSQSYTNASGLSANNITTNSFIAFAAATGAGAFLFSGIFTASSEL